MPSKTRAKNTAIAAKSAALPKIPKELLDQFVQGPMTAEAIQDVSMAVKKALIERALGGELSHDLGYAPGADNPAETDNHRNGRTGKAVLTEDGPLRIEVLRDRGGSFEPLLIPKHERRFTGFDDKIVAMYARGMTVREIQGFLAEQYGTEVCLSTGRRHRTAPELRPRGQGGRVQGGPLCARQAMATHAPREQAAANLAGPRHPRRAAQGRTGRRRAEDPTGDRAAAASAAA